MCNDDGDGVMKSYWSHENIYILTHRRDFQQKHFVFGVAHLYALCIRNCFVQTRLYNYLGMLSIACIIDGPRIPTRGHGVAPCYHVAHINEYIYC